MASSVQQSPITGFNPVWSSDDSRESLLRFRSIERTGYLTVTELTKDFLYDAAQEAALKIVNVIITETHLSNATAKKNNIEFFTQTTTVSQTDVNFLSQRIRSIKTAGAGYSVGDELYHFANGANANVKITVTSVDEITKGITAFEVLHSGDYSSTNNPRAASKRLEFRRKTPSVLEKTKDYSYDSYTVGNNERVFVFQGRHSGNGYVGGTPGPTPVPVFLGIVATQPANSPNYENPWTASFTSPGMPDGRGGAANINSISPYTITATLTAPVEDRTATRWPSTGLWSNITLAQNNQLYVGSEILLRPGFANVTSTIPAGTLITSIDEIEVVKGLLQVAVAGSPGAYNYYEQTEKYIYFTTSNPITVDKGDQYILRGNGATFSDVSVSGDTAEIFTVITESQPRIDPLAKDRQTVFANVVSISNNLIRLNNITHAATDYAPMIFEGMTVEHNASPATSTNGAVVANIVNYQPSATVGQTTANIYLDIAIPSSIASSPAGTGLRFSFNVDQEYRLAFQANGKQTLNVFAATAVQLRDNGNIARVTDYTGAVTDLSGVMGDVPSEVVLSNVNVDGIGGERITNATASVDNAHTNAPYLNVTAYNGSAKIGYGYVVDPTHYSGSFVNVCVLGDQILPTTGSETIGGKGRYRILSSGYTANVASKTHVNIGKVIDRRVSTSDITQGFINRSVRVADHPQSYPLSYFASFTNRGLFFGVWEGSWSIMQKSRSRQLSERDAWFSWFLVQRPVNRKNGQVRTSGQSPVFCINSVGYKYWKFVVRERDVMHPTQGDSAATASFYNDITGLVETRKTPYRVPADAHTDDNHAILNSTHQIALTEDSKYLVSFLYNLTTPRFRYSDELDMIGQTAGDVSMASSDIKITAYSEATQRVYKSLSANLPYNAGLRICVLKDIYTA